MSKTLIVCPLAKELSTIRNFFSSEGLDVQESRIKNYPVYRIPQKNLYLAVGGHGKVQFGIQTQFFLSHLEGISAVLCVGAGGGLSPAVSVFDVVVGDQTIEHDYQKKFNTSANFPSFKGNQKWVDLLSTYHNGDFKVHRGSIASGDEDIVDPERARELFDQTQALAVAWEGAGGARASYFHKVPFVEIRAITDNARDNVASSFQANLPRAMTHVAKVLYEVG